MKAVIVRHCLLSWGYNVGEERAHTMGLSYAAKVFSSCCQLWANSCGNNYPQNLLRFSLGTLRGKHRSVPFAPDLQHLLWVTTWPRSRVTSESLGNWVWLNNFTIHCVGLASVALNVGDGHGTSFKLRMQSSQRFIIFIASFSKQSITSVTIIWPLDNECLSTSVPLVCWLVF